MRFAGTNIVWVFVDTFGVYSTDFFDFLFCGLSVVERIEADTEGLLHSLRSVFCYVGCIAGSL